MSHLFGEGTFQDVVDELRLLNPKANIVVNETQDGIVCNRSADRLYLPKGFYVTMNDSLCNMGNTLSPNFMWIGVSVKKRELSQKPKLRFLDKVKLALFKPKMKAPVQNKFDREM